MLRFSLSLLERFLSYHKEEILDKKSEQYEKRESTISNRERNAIRIEEDLTKKQQDLEALLAEQRHELERLAGISSREAKDLLMKSMESEAKYGATKLIRRIDSEAKETAKRKAQETLALAVKRYAGEYVTERTVSVVNLPNDEMKGRIIGREGRNIRAIEAATGVISLSMTLQKPSCYPASTRSGAKWPESP